MDRSIKYRHPTVRAVLESRSILLWMSAAFPAFSAHSPVFCRRNWLCALWTCSYHCQCSNAWEYRRLLLQWWYWKQCCSHDSPWYTVRGWPGFKSETCIYLMTAIIIINKYNTIWKWLLWLFTLLHSCVCSEREISFDAGSKQMFSVWVVLAPRYPDRAIDLALAFCHNVTMMCWTLR